MLVALGKAGDAIHTTDMNDTLKKPLPNAGKADTPAPAEKPVPASNSDKKSTKESEEFGGRGGSDPTRFGDWEKDGRCVDF